MSVMKLKPNLCTTYIELDKNFRRRHREANKAKMAASIEH